MQVRAGYVEVPVARRGPGEQVREIARFFQVPLHLLGDSVEVATEWVHAGYVRRLTPSGADTLIHLAGGPAGWRNQQERVLLVLDTRPEELLQALAWATSRAERTLDQLLQLLHERKPAEFRDGFDETATLVRLVEAWSR